MQAHETFMTIIYKSLRHHRFNAFISSVPEGAFVVLDGESLKASLKRLDNFYLEFCDHWESSMDEPSRVCALFMKEVESYLRCLYGTKRVIF